MSISIGVLTRYHSQILYKIHFNWNKNIFKFLYFDKKRTCHCMKGFLYIKDLFPELISGFQASYYATFKTLLASFQASYYTTFKALLASFQASYYATFKTLLASFQASYYATIQGLLASFQARYYATFKGLLTSFQAIVIMPSSRDYWLVFKL